MPIKNTEDTYGCPAKFLHWLIGILIIFLLGLGLWMKGLPATPEKYEWYGLHKSLGITVLALVFIRILWMMYTKWPKMEASLGKFERIAARTAHIALYVLMVGIPLSGWIMSAAGGHPVKWFGLFDVPAPVEKNKELGGFAHDAHEILAYIAIGIIALHIIAALKHHFIDKDNTLKRMMPGCNKCSIKKD